MKLHAFCYACMAMLMISTTQIASSATETPIGVMSNQGLSAALTAKEEYARANKVDAIKVFFYVYEVEQGYEVFIEPKGQFGTFRFHADPQRCSKPTRLCFLVRMGANLKIVESYWRRIGVVHGP